MIIARQQEFFMSHRLTVCLIVATICVAGQHLSADVIQLESGGELRGSLVDSPAPEQEGDQAPLSIRTPSGAVIRVARQAVDFVERRSDVMEEYVTRSRRTPATVEGHWELSEWCRTHFLSDQRSEQLHLLLRIDPDHGEARRILGYIKHHGNWMTRDEVMEQRGYVRYKNDWITPQELALLTSDVKQRKAESEWLSKIRVWTGWLENSDQQRQRDAVGELEKIRDVHAIPALTKMLGLHNNVNVRMLYVRVLSQIPSRESVLALVDRYLFDPHEPLRQKALTYLQEGQTALAITPLISGLNHQSNEIVRRAARGLGSLGDRSAVPALIDALVTTHQMSFTTTYVDLGSSGLSSNGNGGMSLGNSRPAIPPDMMAALMTGQLGFQPNASQIKREVHVVSVPVKNAEVLTALETLTGHNLGFNERDWYVWWSVQKS